MWLKSLLSTSLLLHAFFTLPAPASAQLTPPHPDTSLTLHEMHLRYSDEFGLTGCSPLGDSAALVCLGWVDDALTTCLQWGEFTAIAACIRRQQPAADPHRFPLQFRQGPDVLPLPAPDGWGYRFNLTLP